MTNANRRFFRIGLAPLLLCLTLTAFGQTASFTYQGKLSDNNLPANGSYQMQFGLYDATSGGSQIGATQTVASIPVADGSFAVELGFGAAAFNGSDRYLEVRVFSAQTNSFVVLTPRQQITSAPYSVRSLNAATSDTATNALSLGGTAANQFVVGNDPRMTDARPPIAGSNGYIQNTLVAQAASNFNISGNGSAGGLLAANAVTSATQYNIGANRVLSVAGAANVFAGVGAGAANVGNTNSFVGSNAGSANTSGNYNSFFGANSGGLNTTGNSNAFFGSNAGAGNTTGHTNAFFGTTTGQLNTTGNDNSYFGIQAGFSNQAGSNNSFFGRSAGLANTAGDNSFFGASAGDSNTSGTRNSFFGRSAGGANIMGADNAFFGYQAGLNTIAGFNSFFGSTAGAMNTTGIGNAFFGREAGEENVTGSNNAFFGANTGAANTSGGDNTFIGRAAGGGNTIGSSNTYIGAYAGGNAGITNAAAIGANAFAFASNQIVIGTNTNVVYAPNILNAATLKVSLLSGGGDTPLCRNASQEVAFCSSSLRYKTNLGSFNSGLSLVNRLRPITFDWKDSGVHDLGLGAEDVAAIEPRLVHYNKEGQVEGVKYDRISVVLVNAVREQQEQIKQQQHQIEILRQLVCEMNAKAAVCQGGTK